MAERPIRLRGPMVRAILDGRKTQHREVLRPQPEYRGSYGCEDEAENWGWEDEYGDHVSVTDIAQNKYRVGDLLWVRETWRALQRDDALAPRHLADDRFKITYEADPENRNPLWAFGRLRPSTHMPRWASRLTLEVTAVRVERLQDISEEDAVAEGSQEPSVREVTGARWSERGVFAAFWNSPHTPDAWEQNPWVAAITFVAHRRNVDEMLRERARCLN